MKKSILKMFAVMLVFGVLLYGCSAGASSSSGASVKNDSGTADASDWPKKNIQIIVPFAAGGDTDFNARTYAQFLSEELGTNVVVVNTTGNGGVTGTRKVMESANDGYTILFNTSALLMNMVSGAADYGLDDFEIANIAGLRAGDIITVRGDLGIKTMDDLMAYSKNHPGEMRLAITTGAHNHATALYLLREGLDATLLDAGGTSERMAALLGGHLEIIMNPVGGISDYLETGELVAIANPIAKRPANIPDIPTCLEEGYNVSNDGYYLWAFPKGTDQAIIDKFNAAVEKICMTNPEYQELIKSTYKQEPFYAGQQEAKELLETQYEEMSTLKSYFE